MVCNIAYNLFKSIFSVYLVYELYKVVKYFGLHKCVLPVVWKPIKFTDYGKWAGCTDGIGKAFVYELAKLGMNVVLISRSQQKLDELATNIYSNYKVETKVIVADFRSTNDVMPVINKNLENLDIGVLINNVGTTINMSEFLNNSKQRVNDLIEINMKSMVHMCLAVMQGMVNRKRGIVVNVSSLLAHLPSPRIATVYGSTKAFVTKFSQDLHEEYKNDGIIVHCLTTGPVVTKLFNFKINDWITPTPEKYVQSAMKTIGMVKVTTGYLGHDIVQLGFGLLHGTCPQLYNWFLFRAESSLEKESLKKMSQRRVCTTTYNASSK